MTLWKRLLILLFLASVGSASASAAQQGTATSQTCQRQLFVMPMVCDDTPPPFPRLTTRNVRSNGLRTGFQATLRYVTRVAGKVSHLPVAVLGLSRFLVVNTGMGIDPTGYEETTSLLQLLEVQKFMTNKG